MAQDNIPTPEEYRKLKQQAEEAQAPKSQQTGVPSYKDYLSIKKKESEETKEEISGGTFSDMLSESQSKGEVDLSYLKQEEAVQATTYGQEPKELADPDWLLHREITSQQPEILREAKKKIARNLENVAVHVPTKMEGGEEVPDLANQVSKKDYIFNKAASQSAMFKASTYAWSAIMASSLDKPRRELYAGIMDEVYKTTESYKDPSLFDNVAGTVVGFVSDAPIFSGGASGSLKIASFVERKLMQAGLPKLAAKSIAKKKLLEGVGKASISSAGALGLHTAISDVEDQYADLSYQEWDYLETLRNTTWSTATGAAIGFMGGFMGNLGQKVMDKHLSNAVATNSFAKNTETIAKLKKTGINTAAYIGEVGLFETAHLLQHPEEDFTWDGLLENATFIGLLKGHRAITTKGRQALALKDDSPLRAPLTSTEINSIGMGTESRIYQEARDKPEVLRKLLNDENISFRTKQKLLFGVKGAIATSMPTPSDVEVSTQGIKIYSEGGKSGGILLDNISRDDVVGSFSKTVVNTTKMVDMYNALNKVSTFSESSEISGADKALRKLGYTEGLETPVFKDVLLKPEELTPESHKAIDDFVKVVNENIQTIPTKGGDVKNIKGSLRETPDGLTIGDDLIKGKDVPLNTTEDVVKLRQETNATLKETRDELEARKKVDENAEYRIGTEVFESKEQFVKTVKEMMKEGTFNSDMFMTEQDIRMGDMTFREIMRLGTNSMAGETFIPPAKRTPTVELREREEILNRRNERLNKAEEILTEKQKADEKAVQTQQVSDGEKVQEAAREEGEGKRRLQEEVLKASESPVEGLESTISSQKYQSTTEGEKGLKIDISTEKSTEPVPMDIPSKANRFIREWTKASGVFPKKVFKYILEQEGKSKAALKQIEFTSKDFKSAAKKAYGKTFFREPKLSTENIEQLDTALKNLGEKGVNRDEALKDIPQEMHEPLIQMRGEIDALSREMIRRGVIEGDLVGKVTENLGFYLNRSYKMFEDPKYRNWDKIPEEVKNNAVSFIKGEYPELTEAQINTKLRLFLTEAESPFSVFVNGKLGSKDTGLLKARKDIPEPMRAFMGEYKDPLYNYANSVFKMSDLIAKDKMLNDIKKFGEGYFLFNENNVPSQGEYKRIKGKEGRLDPLNNMYAPSYLVDAIESFGKSTPSSKMMQHYMKINGVVKYGKTILSPQTHVRNYTANFMFHMANGRDPFMAVPTTVKRVFSKKATKSSKEWREYTKELIERGIIDDNANAGELKAIINDSYDGFNNFQKASDGIYKKFVKGGLDLTNKLYQGEDNVHKIYAYESEAARYKEAFEKAYPDKSDAEITAMAKDYATEAVRMTMPVYSLVPKGVKMLRRAPLVGTFVSFPAEIIRTSYNVVDLAAKEMQNPVLREIGKQRMAGVMSAAVLPQTASYMSMYFTGVKQQDRDDMRAFQPSYLENSTLIYLRAPEKGVYTTVDVGYSDPYAYVKQAVTAALKADNVGDAVTNISKELLEPFFGEEMLAGVLLDVYKNKTSDGNTVYNDQLSTGDQIAESLEYVWSGLAPGVVVSGKRISEANKTRKATGSGRDLRNEILAVAGGQRISQTDVGKSFSFDVYDFSKSVLNSKKIFRDALRQQESPKGISEKEFDDAYKNANTALERNVMELHDKYIKAKNLGVPERELRKALSNLTDAQMGMVIKGRFSNINRRNGDWPPKSSSRYR